MHKDWWNIKCVFLFLVKFAVRAEQRGHKEMMAHCAHGAVQCLVSSC